MPRKRSPIVAGGYVEAGRIQWDNAKLAMAPLKAWEHERVTITIAQERLTRSERAHKYYWFLLGIIAEDTGHSKDELHEIFKSEWNGKTVFWTDPTTGEMTERRIPRSTTTLKSDEFYDYVENVRFYAAESLGISTPEPDPEYWRKANEKRVA